jgi:hypothetical protein
MGWIKEKLFAVTLRNYFFTPRTESFDVLATRNLTTVLAGILIFCIDLGLRRVRQPDPARLRSLYPSTRLTVANHGRSEFGNSNAVKECGCH